MEELPHRYVTTAKAEAEGTVQVESPGLPTLSTAPPAEFGGPGDLWSPETFLTAAVADCFVLSFRAIARASKIEWNNLECHVIGYLDRPERQLEFTKFDIDVKVRAASGTDPERAQRVIEKAEKNCLVTNSLKAELNLTSEVEVD